MPHLPLSRATLDPGSGETALPSSSSLTHAWIPPVHEPVLYAQIGSRIRPVGYGRATIPALLGAGVNAHVGESRMCQVRANQR